MENTLENKGKFFGLYWGQKVALYKIGASKFGDSEPIKVCLYQFNVLVEIGYDFCLELTPLSDITDEDAIYLAKIEKDFENPIARGRFLAVQINTSFFRIRSGIFIQMIDFLRSKGYALPWLDTTVEEQIEFGWVKLKNKTDEN